MYELIKTRIRKFNQTLAVAGSSNVMDGAMSELFGDGEFMAVVEDAINNSLHHKEIKSLVDDECREIIQHSGLLRRSREKPFGYPGDFEVLEHIYDRRVFDDSTKVGKLIDLWAIDGGLPTAVVQRKNALAYLLSELTGSNSYRSFLSIGAGTAREVRDLCLSNVDVTFDMVDFDVRTQQRFEEHGQHLDCVKYHIFDVFKDSIALPLKRYDVVYSFGLFDYVPDKYLNRLMTKINELLGDDSLFIFALKDKNHYNAWFYDLLCDWRFIQRSREDGYRLAKQWELSVIQTLRVENRAVNIFVTRKI